VKKKVLTMACSAALGLTGGMQHAYAVVDCVPTAGCTVTYGGQADISGEQYDALEVTNGGRASGDKVVVDGDVLVAMGGNVHLVDSEVFGGIIHVRDDSSLHMEGRKIDLEHGADARLEVSGSTATLEGVDVTIAKPDGSGILVHQVSSFNMERGSINSHGGAVHIAGDPSGSTTWATFTTERGDHFINNIGSDATALIVEGNAEVSLEGAYGILAFGDRSVALAVRGEGAKVDTRGDHTRK